MKIFAEGKKNLTSLISSLNSASTDWNEAQTRFRIIDEIIESCLGWDKEEIGLEVSQERKYSDYELGNPRQVIWEAKREGKTFELPANPKKNHLIDIQSIIQFSEENKKAINQVKDYCSNRGVQIAVVSNGRQIITFLATRTDGKPPLNGQALVFSSLDNMLDNFNLMWQMLSRDGISQRSVIRYLTSGEIITPSKLATHLIQYPKIRYASTLQATLRQLSELLILDISENEQVEEKFFKSCYCESGALSKYALLSKRVLETRYASLFDEGAPYPSTLSVRPKKNKSNFTPDVIVSESISKRPTVLLGDVGVGKTSFIRNLMYTSAYEEFKNAIYIYIDLGSKASLTSELKKFVLEEVESQLLNKYYTDINDYRFIKGVYSHEIVRFSNGLWGKYKSSRPDLYDEKLLEMLEKKTEEKDRHLKSSIQFISTSKKKQIIIALDNADQRNFETQQEAFVISQELAKEWSAAVFISVRPKTFFESKRSGSLSAYPPKVFTISPPRVDYVIEKRLNFAINMATGENPLETNSFISLNSESLVIFLQTLLYSLKNNKDIAELFTNITGGNIRSAIELVTSFIGSPNVDAEKINRIMEERGRYIIPVHEFTKSALLGDYSHYNPDTSMAMNLFDVKFSDSKEHFLVPILLALLDSEHEKKDKDGFISTKNILTECQSFGFVTDQTEYALRRSTNKKIIETSQRITFAEDESGLIGEMPAFFRGTSIGAYHLKKWMGSFAYLDAMVFDTPIFDSITRKLLMENLESLHIKHRYDRAKIFKTYLKTEWNKMQATPTYLDFPFQLEEGDGTFNPVANAVKMQKKDY